MAGYSLFWSGHSSFRLDASKRIYFDPCQLSANPPGADIICVTHEHFDHCSLEDLELITTRDTVILSDNASSVKMRNIKSACKEARVLSAGDNIEIGNVKVSAVSSYNIGKPFHTRESGKLGFIVLVDGIKFYHSGDTDLIPEMESYLCDIALLPVGGTYTMTADEAAQAALIIKPKLAIPMHYDSASDADRFQSLLKGEVEVKILRKEC